MKHFRPKGSPYFGTLEKIITITPENGQFIFGDPNWVGYTSDIREFTVESLFEKIEPVLLPPVTEYRVTKKNGAFFILDTREAAERVAAQESDTEESLEIVERTYRPVVSNSSDPPGQLRVSLPPDIKSVDIFQVFSVAAATYGVFGYFAKFAEPDSAGMGYREQQIAQPYLSMMTTSCLMFCDAAEAANVVPGEEGYSYHGKNIWGDDRDKSYDSWSSLVTVLDDGNPRGIVMGAQFSGSFHAVYEGEDDEASLIGILALASTVAGPHSFSDEEIEEKDWGDGDDELDVAIEYEEQGDYENAFRWYEIAAKQGNSYGQSYLGQFYQVGLGVEKDETEAVKWFRLAAEQGNATGLWELGDCYQRGQGVEKDPEEAFIWFQKAYDAGDDERAIRSLGDCYLEGIGVEQDVDKGVSLFRASAEKGDHWAQYRLGFYYNAAPDVDAQNPEEAVKWFRLAAEQGNMYSQWFLARCYQDGDGVEKDLEEAVKWFHASAEQGDEDAQENLIKCYLEGQGVEQDFDKAYQWFCKRYGDDVELNDWFDSMFEYAVEEDVMGWIQPRIDRGDAEFMVSLAGCYDDGTIDAEDDEIRATTEKLYREAAKLGHRIARNIFVEGVIGKFFDEHAVSREEHEEALEYSREGAEGGDRDQQYYLAEIYREGIGVEKNPEEAIRWYRAAAETGDITPSMVTGQAMGKLSECYRDGIGVEKNPEEAEKWRTKAKELYAEFYERVEKAKELAAESPDSDD